jgi:hypothetical protein
MAFEFVESESVGSEEEEEEEVLLLVVLVTVCETRGV